MASNSPSYLSAASRICCFLLALLLTHTLHSQENNKDLVLLKPTGEVVEDLIEMSILQDTSQMAKEFDEILNNSFISQVVDIHHILQIYLKNTTGKPLEPAYLAFTKTQGGYARRGFFLKDSAQKKERSFFVDIHENTLNRPYASLMSVTQLYPHELGHIMYRLLSENDTLDMDSKNVNVHFFSMITDYSIAFNEGFAEHMENVARLFETNLEVIDGINKDTSEIVKKSSVTVPGFRKDFLYPWRFGFYKMSMLAWYQPFEDYKRFSYPINRNSKFLNDQISISNRQSNLIYRNSGVAPNRKMIRNQVQSLANEGIISTFFTQFSLTESKDFYLEADFYRPFVVDSILVDPKVKFTPLQNLFIKYFHVLRKHVSLQLSEKAQLIDFIEGYIQEFPDESDLVLATYRESTGSDFRDDLPPQLWLLVKGRSHGVLAMDPYAGLSVPVYTFELNGAELEDFMMIEGVIESDVNKILDHRQKNGLFSSYSELYNIPGLAESTVENIRNSEFDQEYFDNLPFPDELSISSVIAAPVRNLIIYTLVYFVVFMAIYYWLLAENQTMKKKMWNGIKYLLLWLVFVLTGLVIAASGAPWYYLGILILIASIPVILIKKVHRKRTWIMEAMMSVVILVSLI